MDFSKLESLAVTPLENGVYHVELNRPKSSNAVNMTMWKEFNDVFQHLQLDGDCRVIVLSARGKGFSVGLDLLDPSNYPPYDTEDVGRKALTFINHASVMQAAFTSIERCLKPVICVIHGACVGAGVDLITATDIRLCSKDALFSVREVAGGLAADVGTLARLPKIVGSDSWVRELTLTARDCGADEALAQGLVSDVLPDKEAAVDAALTMAKLIASHSPIAVLGTKKNINFARDHSVQDSLDYVLTWNAAMIQGDDVMKVVGAAMQKKKPEFPKL